MGDREVPTKIEIIPQNKKGQKTVLQINRMQFNSKIEDSFFSQQNMRKIK
jgi:outer membrane lipoprotein-sorting protein